ncbi:MAG: prephenate dehydratase domain-containing protein, partial [Alloprevotella sp.]|nr:prephenate dehydratase domain-containing protein [Alloprevotella sp.]
MPTASFARLFFDGESACLVCCDSFEELFRRLADDEEMVAVAAIENTIAGSLLRNYELLRQSPTTIVGEQKLHV